MKDIYVSKALKAIRHYNRYSQSQIATVVGISKSAVSDAETGNKPVSLGTVERYATAFDLSVADVFTLAEGYRRKELRKGPSKLMVSIFDWIKSDKTGVTESKGIALDDDDEDGGDSSRSKGVDDFSVNPKESGSTVCDSNAIDATCKTSTLAILTMSSPNVGRVYA